MTSWPRRAQALTPGPCPSTADTSTHMALGSRLCSLRSCTTVLARCTVEFCRRLRGMIIPRARVVTCSMRCGSDASAVARGAIPRVEQLEARLALSTTIAGTITQGNLYGDQSVVLATPLREAGQPTSVQVIDTGDIGMGGQSVRTFTPFPEYSGALNLTVGDFLHRGYQQLIVGTASARKPLVAVYDLFRTFAAAGADVPNGVFTDPLRLQTLTPFPFFRGGVSLAAADFDGDGTDDLAVGAAAGGRPRVNIYSLETSCDAGTLARPHLLNSFDAFSPGFRGGVSLAAGHVTGDTRGTRRRSRCRWRVDRQGVPRLRGGRATTAARRHPLPGVRRFRRRYGICSAPGAGRRSARLSRQQPRDRSRCAGADGNVHAGQADAAGEGHDPRLRRRPLDDGPREPVLARVRIGSPIDRCAAESIALRRGGFPDSTDADRLPVQPRGRRSARSHRARRRRPRLHRVGLLAHRIGSTAGQEYFSNRSQRRRDRSVRRRLVSVRSERRDGCPSG